MNSGRSAKRTKNTSKFISLILRHKPGNVGISLDEHGWANVQELIDGVADISSTWRSWKRSSGQTRSSDISLMRITHGSGRIRVIRFR